MVHVDGYDVPDAVLRKLEEIPAVRQTRVCYGFLEQPHRFRLSYGGDLLQLLQHVIRHRSIHVDDGDGFARLRGRFRAAPPQREVRDVDLLSLIHI